MLFGRMKFQRMQFLLIFIFDSDELFYVLELDEVTKYQYVIL